MQSQAIVLTTDFGLFDCYAAVMKGVILSITDNVKMIDLSHTVEPQNIKQAAYLLSSSVKYFPEGSIFLTVVDPGVGTDRKPVAIKAGNRFFVAPNNGILSYIINDFYVEESVVLDKKEYFLENVSNTFHGRDIFAPIAAHIAAGKELHQLGSHVDVNKLATLAKPKLYMDDQHLTGEVVHIDRFGNLITNLKANMIEEADKNEIVFSIGGHHIKGLSENYAAVEEGIPLVYTGSSRFVEIAVRNGSAANVLGCKIGNEIQVIMANED